MNIYKNINYDIDRHAVPFNGYRFCIILEGIAVDSQAIYESWDQANISAKHFIDSFLSQAVNKNSL